MPCKNLGYLVLLSIGAAFTLAVPGYGQGARAILDLSDYDLISFVQSAIERGFPDNQADEMTMLIINRSSLVVPLIEGKVEEVLKSNLPSRRFVDTASEMIAYAGDEESLRAISKLMAVDPTRFGTLVSRALDNSLNYRNPFTVIYRALRIGDDEVSKYVTLWCESALATDRMKNLWAQAMLDRYGNIPSPEEWQRDPLASRLKPEQRTKLQESVTRFGSESRGKRDK